MFNNDMDSLETDLKQKDKGDDIIQSKRPIRLIILIVVSVLIIATVITLLVGHFKYNWFTKEEQQTYDIDANISRDVYQTNYFTQTKTINTRVKFTEGAPEYTEQEINTNFMVMLTDRKKLGSSDFLNTATLVILEANATFEEETRRVTSFNIFDGSTIQEFKSNPNGTKYPMSIFSFYENGTLADILLPNDIDNYNAHLIVDLIEDVIPKLSRNKTEDAINGLKVESKQKGKKLTLFENQSPKEIKSFKGSKFTKLVEREIEEGKLTSAKTYSALLLQNNEGKGNIKNEFGFKDFQYDSNSEIKLTGIKEEKKNAELLKDLAKYYTFIKSKELLEKKKQTKEYVINEWEVDAKDSQIRNLDDETSTELLVKEFEVLGVNITIKLKVGLDNGKAHCQLIIESDLGALSIGPEGVSGELSKKFEIDQTIFSFDFPPFPAIGIDLKVSASVDFHLKACTDCEHYVEVGLKGDLNAAVELRAGWEKIGSAVAGVEGTICSAELTGYLGRNYTLGGTGSFTGGSVTVYVKVNVVSFNVLDKSWEVWAGWTYTFNGEYNIKLQLSREVYQTNYFTETKTINTRVGFIKGSPQYFEQEINTNFLVMQTDRKELGNNDFLNTATLVILEANAILGNETRNVTSFNIFDESTIEEFKSNPNGTKYPMSIFSFYENGTLADILLPNDIDDYNAHLIVDLIEDVIPKISRNDTEDAINGLKVESKKEGNKILFIENQSPKEIKELKGSKFTKLVQREIEEGKLTNAKTYSALLLTNNKDEDESIDELGLKDFQYDSNSEIKLTGIKEEKKNAELLKDLAKYYTFIKSKELLEKKKQTKEYVKDSQIRNLDDEQSDSIIIKQFKIIGGLTLAIKIKMGLENGQGYCIIIIESNLGSYSFGPKENLIDQKVFDFDKTIFHFSIPGLPLIGLDLRAKGGMAFTLSTLNHGDHCVEATLKGNLDAVVAITAGYDSVASVSAGVQGNICSAELTGYLNSNYALGGTGTFSGGALSVFVEGQMLNYEIFHYDKSFWDGWQTTFNKEY